MNFLESVTGRRGVSWLMACNHAYMLHDSMNLCKTRFQLPPNPLGAACIDFFLTPAQKLE
jgi:hypothetical protein